MLMKVSAQFVSASFIIMLIKSDVIEEVDIEAVTDG